MTLSDLNPFPVKRLSAAGLLVAGFYLGNLLEAKELNFPNPLMPGADPHAVLEEGTFWVYPTWSRNGQEFYGFSTRNLKDWEKHGPVLRLADVSWIKEDGETAHYAWAPGIVKAGGRFYFYYSVGPQAKTPSRIGVAVGPGPAGPFRDCGHVLVTGGSGFEAIDPMVWVDPKSGASYLFAGGSAGAALRIYELGRDMVSVAKTLPVETPQNFTEGAFLHEHGGLYHLTYSHGNYRDSTYSVHYATSPSPTGPWRYRGPILTSDATHKGPGHHSVVQKPDGTSLIFYHCWLGVKGEGPYRGSRQICVDRLEYDAAGLIKPVVMTGGGN